MMEEPPGTLPSMALMIQGAIVRTLQGFSGGPQDQTLHLLESSESFRDRSNQSENGKRKLPQDAAVVAFESTLPHPVEFGEKIEWKLDRWHLARYLDKNLRAAAKKKDYAVIKSWIKPIKKHLYFAIEQGALANDSRPAATYSIYAHMSTMHLNALTQAELSGERVLERVDEVRRKCNGGETTQLKHKSAVEQFGESKSLRPSSFAVRRYGSEFLKRRRDIATTSQMLFGSHHSVSFEIVASDDQRLLVSRLSMIPRLSSKDMRVAADSLESSDLESHYIAVRSMDSINGLHQKHGCILSTSPPEAFKRIRNASLQLDDETNEEARLFSPFTAFRLSRDRRLQMSHKTNLCEQCSVLSNVISTVLMHHMSWVVSVAPPLHAPTHIQERNPLVGSNHNDEAHCMPYNAQIAQYLEINTSA
ncbi:unnamed protein product [Cylicocyclus nassatus]|uniref:Folliculin-interacting protein middle domain-containing protein n=1 Tax=Cylicocyclus nassatus TaxID=53992 RepID=A0AA36GSZ8_CYLNA|nr:unnamed protein product [Cylicocyclus nassatus]